MSEVPTAVSNETKLFFISAKTGDGDSLDLFVVAADKGEAANFWRGHYELEAADTPEWIGAVPGCVPTRDLGPIEWDAIKDD